MRSAQTPLRDELALIADDVATGSIIIAVGALMKTQALVAQPLGSSIEDAYLEARG